MRASWLSSFAICGLVTAAAAQAGAPDGPFGSNGHSAAELRWASDGTRAALAAHVRTFFGQQKNTFGPLQGGQEGVIPEGSEYLGDFVPAVIGIPGPEAVLADDTYFYSGAEAHNAGREAAVITQGRGGDVLAVAVLTGKFEAGKKFDELTIIVPGGQADSAMQATFTGWAQGEIDRSNAIIKGSRLARPIEKLVVHTRAVAG